MARLDVTEYENIQGHFPVEPGKWHGVIISIKPNSSKPIGPATKIVRICADVACMYMVSKDKYSGNDLNGVRLWPKQAVDLVIPPGYLINVIAAS